MSPEKDTASAGSNTVRRDFLPHLQFFIEKHGGWGYNYGGGVSPGMGPCRKTWDTGHFVYREEHDMKRLTAIIVLLAALLALAGCGDSVTIGAFSSKYFNGEDYDAAVQEVMAYFQNFEGCTLKTIGYAGDDAVKAEAENRGLAPEQVMVLTSTFETDGEDHHNGLEPDHTYEDYLWILTRHTSAEPWEHTDHGYN